jgi:glycosyltransferase involved in cell wall biosynthesis
VNPAISVVIPTHNRPAGLRSLAEALCAQSLSPERFEVIVVDDGSAPPARICSAGLSLRVLRHEQPQGPAAARNTGWRVASAPLVAFLDDDCTPVEGWLAALLKAAGAAGSMAVIQGAIKPRPDQGEDLHPLAHTIEVTCASQLFVSANIAYPRSLLERLGGFDERFRRSGEDVELGARAIKAGAHASFASDALAFHEVRSLDLAALIRHTVKWTDSVRAVSMHPELRGLLTARVFWKPTHPRLLLAATGLLSRRPGIAALAAAPYLAHYWRVYRGRPGALARALPTHTAVDACEIGTVLVGSIRHRTLML